LPSALPLEGERVRVRALERRDLDERQAWTPFNDPLGLIWDMPRCSPEENDRWFARLTDGRSHLAYGVTDRAGRLIGMLSLRDISWGDSARLGIAFCPEFVNQRYGSETLRLFFPYYFYVLGFRRMVLDVAAANVRAVRCYLRVGFRQTAAYWRPVDVPVDLRQLDHPEYEPLRPFFRRRWGRVETLYYDMELTRSGWEAQGCSADWVRNREEAPFADTPGTPVCGDG